MPLIRGEGGNVLETDIPAEGTVHREVFDDMIRKGLLTIVDEDGLPVVESEVIDVTDFGEVPADLTDAELDELTAPDVDDAEV